MKWDKVTGKNFVISSKGVPKSQPGPKESLV